MLNHSCPLSTGLCKAIASPLYVPMTPVFIRDSRSTSKAFITPYIAALNSSISCPPIKKAGTQYLPRQWDSQFIREGGCPVSYLVQVAGLEPACFPIRLGVFSVSPDLYCFGVSSNRLCHRSPLGGRGFRGLSRLPPILLSCQLPNHQRVHALSWLEFP